MFRSAGFVLAGFALWMVAACSGNAEGGDDDGSGGSAPGDVGSGGSATNGNGASSATGSGGSGGGSSSASAGSGGSAGGARYSAREACELFAAASCDKGLECGLVLTQVLGQLVCVQCNPAALQIIVDRCLADGTTDKDKAAVDRCVSSISAQPCSEACVDPNAEGCAVFGELEIGNNTLVCDQRCAE